MKIEALGDSAYILRDLERPADELAAALNAAPPAGLLEAVASYDTVGVYVDPSSFWPQALDPGLVAASRVARSHEIPVCYERGPDLEEAAQRLSLTPDTVVRLHTAAEYRCFAVGFCPGFAYLGYLPAELAGLPRREEPRVRVEPGSLGITGRQTGVYPLPRPGGWWLIGQTPLTLVDVEDDYFPILAGDTVRFRPIRVAEFDALKGARL